MCFVWYLISWVLWKWTRMWLLAVQIGCARKKIWLSKFSCVTIHMLLVLAFLASPTIFWNFERIALLLPLFTKIKNMKYVTQKDQKHTLLLVTNVPSSEKSGWRRMRSAGCCAGHCATRSKSAECLSDFARTPACNPSSSCRVWFCKSEMIETHWTFPASICHNYFTFADSRKPDLWTYVFLPFPFLPLLFW